MFSHSTHDCSNDVAWDLVKNRGVNGSDDG